VKLARLLYLAAIGPAITDVVLLAIASTLAEHARSIGSLPYVYALSFSGTALMGLFGAWILRRSRLTTIGFVTSAISAAVALSATTLTDQAHLLAIPAVLAFIAALDNPTINSSLNYLVPAAGRTTAFAELHTVVNLASVIFPLAGAVAIVAVGPVVVLFACGILYLVGAIPWIVIVLMGQGSRVNLDRLTNHSLSIGYRMLWDIPALRMLTASRLLNNLIFAAVPIVLSALVARSLAPGAVFAEIQGVAIAFIRAGTLATGVLASVAARGRHHLGIYLARLATPLGAIGLIGLSVSNGTAHFIFACCFVLGIGQFLFRLSGTVLGPAVTPPDMMSEIILAGDTINRLFAALYSLMIAEFLTGATIISPAMIIAALIALPAPLLLQPAIRAFRDQLRPGPTPL
jgi:MFS family permease